MWMPMLSLCNGMHNEHHAWLNAGMRLIGRSIIHQVSKDSNEFIMHQVGSLT